MSELLEGLPWTLTIMQLPRGEAAQGNWARALLSAQRRERVVTHGWGSVVLVSTSERGCSPTETSIACR